MQLNLKDTTFLVLAFILSIVLFYAYLIQYLAQVQGKKITDYFMGKEIQDSNLLLTIGAAVSAVFIGYTLTDEITKSNTM